MSRLCCRPSVRTELPVDLRRTGCSKWSAWTAGDWARSGGSQRHPYAAGVICAKVARYVEHCRAADSARRTPHSAATSPAGCVGSSVPQACAVPRSSTRAASMASSGGSSPAIDANAPEPFGAIRCSGYAAALGGAAGGPGAVAVVSRPPTSRGAVARNSGGSRASEYRRRRARRQGLKLEVFGSMVHVSVFMRCSNADEHQLCIRVCGSLRDAECSVTSLVGQR
jgi:hypothetical protein